MTSRSNCRRSSLRSGSARGQQGVEARVAVLVDHVPEPRQPALRTQGVVERAGGAVALGRDQELVGLLAGSAVQRAGQGGQPGQQGVVEVGSGRRGHPHGQGRGGQLVVRHEDEGGVRRRRPTRRTRCGDQAAGQAGRRSVRVAIVAVRVPCPDRRRPARR